MQVPSIARGLLCRAVWSKEFDGVGEALTAKALALAATRKPGRHRDGFAAGDSREGWLPAAFEDPPGLGEMLSLMPKDASHTAATNGSMFHGKAFGLEKLAPLALAIVREAALGAVPKERKAWGIFGQAQRSRLELGVHPALNHPNAGRTGAFGKHLVVVILVSQGVSGVNAYKGISNLV